LDHEQSDGRVAHLCIAPFHGGCPILAFFARVGGDAAGATLVRSTPPVVYAVVVPAPSTGSGQALRKVREGRGTRAVVAFAV
jgi:hypothetical protein